MAGLPLDIRISKLIIFGYMFNVLDDAVIMAAGLSVRNLFSAPFNEVLKAYSQKISWSNGTGSDLFAILCAYKVWLNKIRQNMFDSNETEFFWAKRYFLQTRAMRELQHLVTDIKHRLANYRLEEIRGNESIRWTSKERQVILKLAICGAFYPNYFHVIPVNERDAFQILGGRDPYNTIYYRGFDPKYIGILYEKRIKELLHQVTREKNIKVSFDQNSHRIFVTFVNSDKYKDTGNSHNHDTIQSLPGRVLTEVYKAVKLRMIRSQSQSSNVMYVMDPNRAVEYAQGLGLGETRNGVWFPVKKSRPLYNFVVPALHVSEMIGTVTFVENCNKFWFQPEAAIEILEYLSGHLNPDEMIPFTEPSDINVGSLVAAPIQDDVDNLYYRVRVLGFYRTDGSESFFSVFYIDSGRVGNVKLSKFRKLKDPLADLRVVPACVFQCSLAGTQPFFMDSPREIWNNRAMREFSDFIKVPQIRAEIYSFVNNNAAVYLRKGNTCINDILVEKKYAQYIEENFMSQSNHEQRVRRQKTFDPEVDEPVIGNELYNEEVEDEDAIECEPPPSEKCRHKITLNGPFNPLETSISPLMKYGSLRRATIDGQSVNSVLLHTDPQECATRLIVSTTISTNRSTQSLTARNTTIMPNIKGFTTLVSLIFSPSIEINRNEAKTRYTSVLCGLGYDPETRESYFEEHDMVIPMDTEITNSDLENINQLRYMMNELLHTNSDEIIPNILESTKVEIMLKIKELLVEIISRPRANIDIVSNLDDFEWGKIKPDEQIPILVIRGNRNIFPPPATPRLRPITSKELNKLRVNCKSLYDLSKVDTKLTVPVDCKLCNKSLESITEIRMHLFTKLHLDREKQINYA